MPFLHSVHIRLILWLLVAVLAIPLVEPTPTAHAASLTVINLNDSGAGSLRQAIIDANLTPEADDITFGVTGTITLTSGELSVTSPITITEPVGGLTISGNNASGIFDNRDSGSLSLYGLTLTGGYRIYNGGGAIRNEGTATISGTQVLSNTATHGGGIQTTPGSTLTIRGSTFRGNSTHAYMGGALDNYQGTVHIYDSTFTTNTAKTKGGAVFSEGLLTVTGSTLTGNTATVSGGGIHNTNTLTVTASDISHNTAAEGGGVYTTNTLTITESTLNENSANFGGGMYNTGTLTVEQGTLSGNSATSSGGAIYNLGTVMLTESTLSSNTSATSGGGAIHNTNSLTIVSSTLSGNEARYGGGIWSTAGSVLISDSTIRDNAATSADGGGINLDSSTATIQSSSIIGNTAQTDGGGIRNGGTLTLSSSTISGNTGTYGGGIENVGSSATASITDSTVSGNTARQYGGGIDNYGATLTVTQSTLSSNTADYGAGIWNDNTLNVQHTTIVNNIASANGGGLYNSGSGSVTLGHTIIADNAPSTGPDVYSGGTVFSQGYNLIGSNSGATSLFTAGNPNGNNDLVGSSAAPIEPLLSALGDYSGHTQTHLPIASSPAVDAGNPSFTPPPATDQLGEPRVQNGRINIGAVEVETLDALQSGTTLVVNITGDPGSDGICTTIHCSLREAVSSANAAADGSTITFSVSGQATLTSGELSVTSPITITEPPAGLTINGNSASRIFNVAAAGTLNLDGLTLTGGKGSDGGAITNAGTANLSGTQVLANTATGSGGGIHNTSTLTITNGTISGNTAATAGGGVWSTAGKVAITNSTVSSNKATNADGGGLNFSGTISTIQGTTIENNSAKTNGGGIINWNVMSISDSVINNNTVSSFGGGGIYNNSSLSLTNTTVSGNKANTLGGGIRNQSGTVTLNYSTITGNSTTGGGSSGGGVRVNGPASLILNHTIVAGNTAVSAGPDIARSGNLTSQGYNLIGKNDTVTSQFPAGQPNANYDIAGTSAAPVDPLLGPLQDNGGTTLTHLPLPGSPAIDAGNPAISSPPSTDQRGEDRVQGLRIDIGAVETPPILSIGDATVTEGDSGVTAASFTVTLNGASTSTVTVNYTSTSGSATAGADYSEASGTLTFAPGTTTQPLNIDVLGEDIDEDDETFSVSLSTPTNATISDNQGLGTIQDDDAEPGISIGDASSAEGNAGTTPLTFTVALSNPSSKSISATYTITDVTAKAGEDYTLSSGSLIFAPGTLTQTLVVDLLGDTLDEFDETLSITLADPVNASMADDEASGAIIDDDTPPTLNISDVTLPEGNGVTTAIFTVTLGVPSTMPISVTYTTAEGTATADADYTPGSGTLMFAPGEVQQTINVAVLGDVIHESTESFQVILSGPQNATITDGEATGTVVDDDSPVSLPSLSIADAAVIEGNSGIRTATFTVTLSGPSNLPITLAYATSNGTATAGGDYNAASGTLTFVPGQTEQVIMVDVLDDTLDEVDELFNVTLSAPTNASIADGDATGSIVDDDAAAETAQKRIYLPVVLH
jgi:CSLREA domain-containing protein